MHKFYFLLITTSLVISSNSTMSKKIISIDFEVFGRVQGVFFRKYTRNSAKEFGVRGWCRNTDRSTVEGQVQGREESVQQMQNWLSNEGSPQSLVSDAKFSNRKELDSFTFHDFEIHR